MSKPSLLVLIGLMVVATLPASAQLSYLESSAGLQDPGLENGRTELELGDINGDGHPDLASMGDHGNPGIGSDQQGIMVWLGDGAGGWTLHQGGNLGYGGIALGDVNNDGLMDVGYGIHHNYSGTDLGNQILEVALGDGTGMSWAPWDDGLASNGEDWGMFGTDFADVDNDGLLDVGSISFGSGSGVHVYRNNGDGTWTQTFGFLGGNSDMIFLFGDVNGDGKADFAAGHGSGTIYFGDGEGGFVLSDGNLPAPAWRFGVDLGDVNADGRSDLSFTTSSGIGVYSWQGGSWQDLSGVLATAGSGYEFTRIADMNSDGFGDMVALSEDHTRVWLGDGAGGWTLTATVPTDDACGVEALLAGVDADHNGYPDFAYVAEEDCQFIVGGTNVLHLFKESSSPATAWIRPVHPRGGEIFVAGSVRFLDWHAAIPPSVQPLPPVDIELSTTGPAGPYTSVAGDLPCSGRYQWTVPAGTPASSQCHLRLTMATEPPVQVVTPAPFTILGADPSGIESDASESDEEMAQVRIEAAFPNPLRGSTTLHLDLPGPERATLSVFDIQGRLVRALFAGPILGGRHGIVWDGRSQAGEEAPAGVYLVRLDTESGGASTAKVVLSR